MFLEILKFIRFGNIIMSILHQCLIYILLREDNTLHYNIFNMCLSQLFSGIHIYVMNDLFDVNTDKINNPNRFLVKYNHSIDIFCFVILSVIICCILSVIFGFMSNKIIGFISLYGVICPFLYNFVQKQKYLFYCKNILVSFTLVLVTISPLIVMKIFNKDLLLISILSFLSTYEREIVKDIEDIKGDMKTGKNTIPVVCGINISKKVIYTIICSICGISLYFFYRSYTNIEKIISLILFFSNFICIYKLNKAQEKKHYTELSKLCKYQMLLGILLLPFVS